MWVVEHSYLSLSEKHWIPTPRYITKLSVVSEYCQSVLVLKTAKITLVGWAICRERKRGERRKSEKWETKSNQINSFTLSYGEIWYILFIIYRLLPLFTQTFIDYFWSEMPEFCFGFSSKFIQVSVIDSFWLLQLFIYLFICDSL